MLALRKPSEEKIREFLASQASLDLTYSAVGATRTLLPAGYAVDRTRLKLGRGNRVFRGGTNALTDWKGFRLGWLETWPVETPIQVGQDVAVVARLMGFWWLNACRIVYTVDKPAEFGFAYGTLPGHAATGEERFLIEWDRNTGDVVVRHPVFFPATPISDLPRLSVPSPGAAAFSA